jgi:putative methylase
VRLHRLARVLEEAVPRIPRPRLDLEQYTTPAELALRLALYASRDEPETIADLGAGTCRLAAAAALLTGARVVAVEVDDRLAPLCLEAVDRLGVSGLVEFVSGRISLDNGPLAPGSIDVVITNPPFGVHRKGADWELLGYAMHLGARAVYAILKSGNFDFHAREAERRGYKANLLEKAWFPLPAEMEHHTSRVRRVEVDVVEFRREEGGARRSTGWA